MQLAPFDSAPTEGSEWLQPHSRSPKISEASNARTELEVKLDRSFYKPSGPSDIDRKTPIQDCWSQKRPLLMTVASCAISGAFAAALAQAPETSAFNRQADKFVLVAA